MIKMNLPAKVLIVVLVWQQIESSSQRLMILMNLVDGSRDGEFSLLTHYAGLSKDSAPIISRV